MDELMEMLTKEVGLSPDQAKEALGGVMGFLKDKLPSDVMDQITSLPGVGDFMNSLGDAAGAATDAAAGAAGAATDTAGGVIDSVKGLFGKS
jgi:hypothetical protein